jgi:hypothetical protein
LNFVRDIFSSNYSNLIVNGFEASEKFSSSSSEYDILLSGVYNNFLPNRNNRIFINPSIFNKKTSEDLPKEEINKRKYSVYIDFPYLSIDTVLIDLPNGYKLESKPSNQNLAKDFGQFTAEYDFRDNKLFYVRKLEMLTNLVPLENYKEFKEFLQKVIDWDKSKFVLKKE